MNKEMNTTCCIAGGGPAGMMLGLLLARAGIEVIVLEKHADFFRDFRGDTIHPSTFNIMHELGLLPEFLKIPHDEQTDVQGTFGGVKYHIADFTHLPVAHKVLGFMPQWDFLDFVLKEAKKYPSFRLMVNAEAKDIIKDGNKVTGLTVATQEGEVAIKAKLVVVANGRGTTLAKSAGLISEDLGAPMDVLWFRLSRQESDPEQTLLNLNKDNIFIAIQRKEYFQCGFIIGKGDFDKLKEKGLPQFKETLTGIIPFAKDRMQELKSWDDVKLLSVSVSHLKQWYTDGLLCIGDAAHTMSPIGGVGINIAVQDAVATANILYAPLKNGTLNTTDLKKVQERRSFPSRIVQKVQVTLQDKIISPVLRNKNKQSKPPIFIRALQFFPPLRRLVGRFIGLGVRPEHVRTPQRK